MELFILGTGRSGTSIFNALIGLHEDVWSFRWESQIFSGLPALCDLVDQDNPVLVRKFVDRCRAHLYKRDVGGRYEAGLFEIISEERFFGSLARLENRLNGQQIKSERIKACKDFSDEIFKDIAASKGSETWAEKTPRNLLYADKIKEIYRSAKFINVVRDGREVVSSIVEKKFWPVARSSRFPETTMHGRDFTVENATDYWCALMAVTEEMRSRVPHHDWIDVRLEDLGNNLDSVQNRIEAFLGVSHDQDFLAKAQDVVKVKSTNKQRWKEGKTQKEIDYMNKRMGRYLEYYQYV